MKVTLIKVVAVLSVFTANLVFAYLPTESPKLNSSEEFPPTTRSVSVEWPPIR